MKYAQLIKAIDSASQKLLGHAAAVVNQSLVIRNWLIGAYVVEFEQHGDDRARYGQRLLATLSRDLKKRGLHGLSISALERMRRFYQVYPQLGDGIPSTLLTESAADRQVLPAKSAGKLAACPTRGTASRKLPPPLNPKTVARFSWSKVQELIRLDDPWKRAFYENECLKGNWSVRQLQRQIGSLLYERTGLSREKAAVVRRAHQQERQEGIEDMIRDPYVLEFTGLTELPRYSETGLEKALLDHLQQFLLELGTGFCFEARQFRVTVGNEHDYLDLVFYHRLLRCHVLMDLKIRPFKHGDAGQMNYYLNYFKSCVMAPGDNAPVGIILCSDRENTKVQFATAGIDNNLFVSRYLVALPSAGELQRFLETDRAQVEALMLQSKRVLSKVKRKRKMERPGI